MSKYTVRAVLATPMFDGDEDVIYNIPCDTKQELHRVEKAFINGLNQLTKLTEDELATGNKAFAGTDPQLVTFEVNITKEGADFGGYTFRWPNQTAEARAFLVGMLDGLMKQTGHQDKKWTKKKVRA